MCRTRGPELSPESLLLPNGSREPFEDKADAWLTRSTSGSAEPERVEAPWPAAELRPESGESSSFANRAAERFGDKTGREPGWPWI
jgi:hypothetical protein